MRDIRAFARRIAAEFKPRRIILFGSYAYGTPTADSDVDLMVVMPNKGNATRQAIKIRLRFDAPVAMDLLVYSPHALVRRYKLEDWFIRDVVDKGKVLYEAADQRVG